MYLDPMLGDYLIDVYNVDTTVAVIKNKAVS